MKLITLKALGMRDEHAAMKLTTLKALGMRMSWQ
jgi:hypothetical protein